MKAFIAFCLIGCAACTSAQSQAVSAAHDCKTDAQVLADAEAALAATKERLKSGKLAQPKPEDAGKSPAQLAEEAATSGEPCGAQNPSTDSEDLPQIQRFP